MVEETNLAIVKPNLAHSGNNRHAVITIEKDTTEVINLTLCDDSDVPKGGDCAATAQPPIAQPARLMKLLHKAKTDLGGNAVKTQNKQPSRGGQNFTPSMASSLPRVSPNRGRNTRRTIISSSGGILYPPSLLTGTASFVTGGHHRARTIEYPSVVKEVDRVTSSYFPPGENSSISPPPPRNTRSALSTPYNARLSAPRNTRNSLLSFGRHSRSQVSAVGTSSSSPLDSHAPIVISSPHSALLPSPSSTSSVMNTSRQSSSPSPSVMFDDTSLGLGCGNSTFSDTRTKPRPSNGPTLSKGDFVYNVPSSRRSRKSSEDEVGTVIMGSQHDTVLLWLTSSYM